MGLDNTIHSSMPHLPEFMPSDYDIGTWRKERSGWAYSFRGALVADVMERITGVSLFSDVIDNDTLHAMAHQLSRHRVKVIYRRDRARYRQSQYDVHLGTVRCLANVFSLLATHSGRITSSY